VGLEGVLTLLALVVLAHEADVPRIRRNVEQLDAVKHKSIFSIGGKKFSVIFSGGKIGFGVLRSVFNISSS
jgi:hypothetical protein